MPPRQFPTHFRIILTPQERSALDTLYELDTQLVDETELLHEVIAAGIREKNRAMEENRDTTSPTRTELTPRNGSTLSLRSAARREVENYLGFPIDQFQQRDVEEFLEAHPYLGEEDGMSILLDLGLRAARDERFILDAPRCDRDATSTQCRLTLLRRLLGSAH